MDCFLIVWVVLVTVATVIFLNYPPPELSPTLKSWYKKGHVHHYKDFKIFYKVEDGVATDDSTLLVIHGFPTSSFDWIKVLDDLKEQYSRIILPDMLGFGFSDKPKYYDYLITEQADIMESILKSLNVDDVHLLSHDYGDTVALEMLHRFNHNTSQARINSLCMLNGGVFPETTFPRPVQKLLMMPFVGSLASHLGFYYMFKRSLGETFGPATQPKEDEMRDFYATYRFNDGNTVGYKLIRYIEQRLNNKERWVGALQTTQVPVHMIYGPADPVNPPVFVEHYKKTVPNPSIFVLRDHIGHYPQWEDPVNVMASYKRFIAKIL